ncbi:MAG TPA: hypothetical protein DEP48_05365 [Persephonella sp.]|uniref:ABC type permease n=1 Tax=Persephonella marina (strain DSM 14350 / EX-H1) TaxID=123214 RepID=C0QPM0_PERMH|nr:MULTISPECIES: hypothetical protein [Persephonella]ACO04870.1 ABC type permease [Persephonella marina EX-H1]HCB69769.1 hypothetical protein [Persephonella sp.]
MIYRIALILYLLAVVTLSSIHDYRFFLFIIPLLILLSFKDPFRLIKKTFISVLPFNLVVSLSYAVISTLKDQFHYDYLLLINLRVFSITFLTFLFFSRFNIFKVFDFSRSLTFLLVLSYSQINTFRRYFYEFKLAFKSRMIVSPSKRDMYNFISSVLMFFANRSVNSSKEITQAMKSRGFFIDR